MQGLALKRQARTEGLLRLPATRDVVDSAVLDKTASCPTEDKRDIGLAALAAQQFHPLVMAGARAFVVLAAAQHLLYLPFMQIVRYVNPAYQRGAHDALMLERQAVEDGYSLIGAELVFASDVEENILPPLTPIMRQTAGHTLRAFCKKEEHHVRTPADDAPCVPTPRVRLFKEEIRGHADTQHLAASHLVSPIPVPLDRIAEALLRAIDFAAVMSAIAVNGIHVAMCAPFALPYATMPWVPNVSHLLLFLNCFLYYFRPFSRDNFKSAKRTAVSGSSFPASLGFQATTNRTEADSTL